jgi:hypothetical protein
MEWERVSLRTQSPSGFCRLPRRKSGLWGTSLDKAVCWACSIPDSVLTPVNCSIWTWVRARVGPHCHSHFPNHARVHTKEFLRIPVTLGHPKPFMKWVPNSWSGSFTSMRFWSLVPSLRTAEVDHAHVSQPHSRDWGQADTRQFYTSTAVAGCRSWTISLLPVGILCCWIWQVRVRIKWESFHYLCSAWHINEYAVKRCRYLCCYYCYDWDMRKFLNTSQMQMSKRRHHALPTPFLPSTKLENILHPHNFQKYVHSFYGLPLCPPL